MTLSEPWDNLTPTDFKDTTARACDHLSYNYILYKLINQQTIMKIYFRNPGIESLFVNAIKCLSNYNYIIYLNTKYPNL